MATRKPTDKQHEDSLSGEAEMARVYRAAAQDAPPVSLDARILAEAQRAVAKPKARGPFGGHWAIPLSTAAVIVLSLGVVLLLSEQGALNHHDVSVPMLAEAPLEAPARSTSPASPALSKPALPAAEAPAKAQPELSGTAQGGVAPPAALSATTEAKKTERAAPAPAAAPLMRERMAEEHVGTMRDDARAKRKLAKETGDMSVTADVIAVQVSGQPGAYQFNVGIRSPDKGCAQYADWWEVVSADGKLLYRRVLLHSHVDEQPFTRSGGPVLIQADTVVWVRAHMNTGGYGGMAFQGSVKTGFKPAVPDSGFATGLARQQPLPEGCDF
jgi:hypothetical protein